MQTNRERIEMRYADVLDEPREAGLGRIVQILDRDLTTAYVAQPPPSVTVAIGRLVDERRRGAGFRSIASRFNPVGWLPRRLAPLVALAAVFLLAGATYAAVTVVDRALEMNTGTQRILSGNLGRAVNLSQTLDGFTVSVRRVYADANQIVIGYTIAGPPGRTFNSLLPFGSEASVPSLIDADGKELPAGPYSWGTGVDTGKVGGVLAYDAAGSTGGQGSLQLRLTMTGVSGFERTNPTDAASVHGFAVSGPIVFNLTVPIVPGRVADVQQTVDVAGVNATLERVIVSDTETQVFLSGVAPAADAELTVGGSSYHLVHNGAVRLPASSADSWAYTTDASLVDQHGPWTLTVKPGPGSKIASPTAGGPWVFHFVVP